MQDNGSWLRTLTRDNVELVRDGIDHIEADAVVTADGERYEADIIVYATGFLANKALCPMQIVGRDGTDLREHVGRATGGVSRHHDPGFPNFFCMYGPGTNLAHGGSLIFHSECQMRYITGCLDAADRRRAAGHGAAPGEARRLVRAQPGRAQAHSSGRTRRSSTRSSRTPHGEIHGPQPVAPRRLLAVDEPTGHGRFHPALNAVDRAGKWLPERPFSGTVATRPAAVDEPTGHGRVHPALSLSR